MSDALHISIHKRSASWHTMAPQKKSSLGWRRQKHNLHLTLTSQTNNKRVKWLQHNN